MTVVKFHLLQVKREIARRAAVMLYEARHACDQQPSRPLR
jgi:hypothetical protein